MRFMILMRASEDTEAGVMPTEKELAEMIEYNQKLADAGVLVDGEGLHPSSRGVRLRLSDGDPVVTDGPFAEVKELIAGYWVFEVDSLRDAVDWAKKCPTGGGEIEIEIRQIFEADDFGDEFTPELRQKEDRLREQLKEKPLTTSATRALVNDINDAWVAGDMDAVVDHLTDDFQWTLVGELSTNGKQGFIDQLQQMKEMKTTASSTDNIVVDGTTATVNGTMTCVDPDGAPSTFGFCDIYKLRGDKVKEMTSYVVGV